MPCEAAMIVLRAGPGIVGLTMAESREWGPTITQWAGVEEWAALAIVAAEPIISDAVAITLIVCATVVLVIWMIRGSLDRIVRSERTHVLLEIMLPFKTALRLTGRRAEAAEADEATPKDKEAE
jgi:hypothetical protein